MNKGGPLPYFQFWQKAYLSSTRMRSLSLASHGLFMLLCCYQWEDEAGTLPEGVAALRRIVGSDREEFDPAWSEVADLFTPCGAGRVAYAPLREQWEATLAKVETLRGNGAKGAEVKKQLAEQKRKQMDEQKRKQEEELMAKQNEPKRTSKSQAKPEPKPDPEPQPNPNTLSGDIANADVREPTLYERIETVLWGRAMRLSDDGDAPRPDEATVKSHLRGTTGLTKIMDRLGLDGTIDLIEYVARTQPANSNSFLRTFNNLDVIQSQMRNGIQNVPRRTSTAPADGRPLSEVVADRQKLMREAVGA